MKVAVVGSKGFIGQRLVKALCDEEHEVVELDLPKVNIVSLLPSDPNFCELLKGTEVLYHLAVMNLEHCKKNPARCIKTNIIGTLNIMDLAKSVGVKRVIYSSASSVYGDQPVQPVRETAQTNPLTLYGVTKLSAEKAVQLYQSDEMTTGIFRFSNVYGPGQVNGIIPGVIQALLKQTEIKITGTGQQTRDFVYVDDVVKILIKAAKRPLYNFLVNLGSGQSVSVNDVTRLCSLKLDKYTRITNIPLVSDRNAFCADRTLFRQVFGEYPFTPFGEGLDITIQWWKDTGGVRNES